MVGHIGFRFSKQNIFHENIDIYLILKKHAKPSDCLIMSDQSSGIKVESPI